MNSPVVSFAIAEVGKRLESRDFITANDLIRNALGQWHCMVQHRIGDKTIVISVLIDCNEEGS
jgi:hypothetical protein